MAGLVRTTDGGGAWCQDIYTESVRVMPAGRAVPTIAGGSVLCAMLWYGTVWYGVVRGAAGAVLRVECVCAVPALTALFAREGRHDARPVRVFRVDMDFAVQVGDDQAAEVEP